MDQIEAFSSNDGVESSAVDKGNVQMNHAVGNRDDHGRKPGGRGKFFLLGFVTGLAVFFIAFSCGACTALYGFLNSSNTEPQITDAFISGKLESVSEIISAKYIYSGVRDYEEGSIPVINRSKFSMYYTATVRAGIEDAADIQKEVTDTEVILTLPASRILDVHINPASLRYFDKEDPLIHPNDREQVPKLLELSEEDAKIADMSELLDLADEQLEKIMTELFKDAIGDHQLVIKHAERTVNTAEGAVIDLEGNAQ